MKVCQDRAQQRITDSTSGQLREDVAVSLQVGTDVIPILVPSFWVCRILAGPPPPPPVWGVYCEEGSLPETATTMNPESLADGSTAKELTPPRPSTLHRVL